MGNIKRAIGLVLGVLATVLGALLVPAPAAVSAGGWALASFDPFPQLERGEEAVISFRLLQHGRTPVSASEWPEASVRLAVRGGDPAGTPGLAAAGAAAAASAAVTVVEAVPTGELGRFVATITVPDDADEVALRVDVANGLIVPEHWVTAPVQGGGGGPWALRPPPWTAPLLALLAVALLGAVVADVLAARRRAGAPA